MYKNQNITIFILKMNKKGASLVFDEKKVASSVFWEIKNENLPASSFFSKKWPRSTCLSFNSQIEPPFVNMTPPFKESWIQPCIFSLFFIFRMLPLTTVMNSDPPYNIVKKLQLSEDVNNVKDLKMAA